MEDRAKMEAGGVLVAELLALGPDALESSADLLAVAGEGGGDDVARAAVAVGKKLAALAAFVRENVRKEG